jgi:hypothetical protein
MSKRKAQSNTRQDTTVVYVPLGELVIYEIDEATLNKLESGPEGQLNLNFALALIPCSISILLTLLTVDIVDTKIYLAFTNAFLVFAILGLYFLIKWYQTHKKHKDLIKSIRDRVPKRPLETAPIQIASELINPDEQLQD